MNELFTDKYLPKDIKSYTGFSHQSALRYIENVLTGKEKKKAIIFHGLPGTGKTTLAQMLPDHFGLSYHYTNASDQRKKKDVNSDIFRTTSLQSEKSLIILDECDGLSKSAFKELERILKKYNQPVILIANNLEKIPYPIRKICHIEKFAVDRFSMLALANKVTKKENIDLSREDIKKIVDQSTSFRGVLHGLQFGVVGTNPTERLSTDTTVLNSLQGHAGQQFLITDLSDLIIRMNDASNSPHLIALADLWQHRYVSGYTYGKFIVKSILLSIRNPGIKKLEYPRTYKLIHESRTGKKMKVETTDKKKPNKPKIKILGFK
jgi:energy-coupling factor transporter ATP-binding protein EcfA2